MQNKNTLPINRRGTTRFIRLMLSGAVAGVGLPAGLLALPEGGGSLAGVGGTSVAAAEPAAQRGCPRVLVLGDRGQDVRQLQRRLNRAFREINQNPLVEFQPIAVDGIYGPQTEALVVAYQQFMGDIPDAVVGPEMWRRLGAC